MGDKALSRLEAFPGMLVVTGDTSRFPSEEPLRHEYVVCSQIQNAGITMTRENLCKKLHAFSEEMKGRSDNQDSSTMYM